VDHEKKTVIVKEIEHWRRSKLLPDQYCDFLLNLYRNPETVQTRQERKRIIVESHPLLWFLLFGIAALFCYVGLNFSSFPPPMQMSLFIAIVGSAHALSAYLRQRRPLASYSLFGIGAFVLLIGGASILLELGLNHWGILALYVSCCAAVWILFGLVLRVPWILLCGWVGLLLAYAIVVNRVLEPQDFYILQLCWVPLAFLFGWVGWLLSRKDRNMGIVFFTVACLVWFAPEVYTFLWGESTRTEVQMGVITKLLMLGATTFTLRKTWTEWVV
jgi:hypothetical protein